MIRRPSTAISPISQAKNIMVIHTGLMFLSDMDGLFELALVQMFRLRVCKSSLLTHFQNKFVTPSLKRVVSHDQLATSNKPKYLILSQNGYSVIL